MVREGIAFILISLFLLANSELDEIAKKEYNVCLHKEYAWKKCFTTDFLETLAKNLTGEYKAVDISNNTFPIIRKGFLLPMDHVNGLWITNCSVSKIEPGAFEDFDYREIALDDNEITRIEHGVFSGQSRLNSLFLKRNLIEFIHKDAFVDMPFLQLIALSHNRLKYWDPNWFSKGWLTLIYMDHNLLEELPDSAFVFPNVPPLVINFRNNRIKTLSNNTFKDAKAVNSLLLASNQLTEFGEHLLKDTWIYGLDISDNKIQCLPQNLTNVIKAVQCTIMKDNPITCSCSQRIRDFARSNKKCYYDNFKGTCPT